VITIGVLVGSVVATDAGPVRCDAPGARDCTIDRGEGRVVAFERGVLDLPQVRAAVLERDPAAVTRLLSWLARVPAVDGTVASVVGRFDWTKAPARDAGYHVRRAALERAAYYRREGRAAEANQLEADAARDATTH